jgi:hypothetical protein
MDEWLRFVARVLEGEKMAPLCGPSDRSKVTFACALGTSRGETTQLRRSSQTARQL